MPPELRHYKRLTQSPLFGLMPDEDGNMPQPTEKAPAAAAVAALEPVAATAVAELAESLAAAPGGDGMDLDSVAEEGGGSGGGNADEDGDEDTFGGFMLRDYQLEGVNWLVWNWFNKRPSILADEM